MPELVKATLTEINGNLTEPRDLSPAMDVQLNPSSLRLSMSNQSDGGKTPTRPQHQYLGSGTRTLSFELVFDTADEGTTEQPRPVTEKTALVERFVLPQRAGDGDVDPPPRVRFSWGSLTVEGIVDSLGIDIDHFAADGIPLRARCSLSIREQDATLELRESSGAGRSAGQPPTPTAAASGGLGLSGGLRAGVSARVGVAIGGESLVDFSARMGLDPGAWRDLGAGVDGTLSLEAGAEIGFSASASAGLGLGLSGGVSAGASTSLAASFGVDVGADLKLGASPWGGIDARLDGAAAGAAGGAVVGASATSAAGLSTGLALSEAGGLSAAIESVKTVYAEAGAQAARSAFADPAAVSMSGVSATEPAAADTATASAGAAASAAVAATAERRSSAGTSSKVPSAAGTAAPVPRPGPPAQPRTPLRDTGLPAPGSRAAPAPAPPRADPRAVSFGLGVPLRSTWGEAARDRAGGGLGMPPVTDDPQVPPWQALPEAGRGEAGCDRRRSALDCLCVCPPRRRGPGRS